MSKQPIRKGRLSAVVEKYAVNDQATGQQVMKNRYATLGRVTVWPSDDGMGEDISIEIDCIPVGVSAPLKAFIFYDDVQAQQGQQPVQQQGYQQPPQQGYQQPGF